MGEADRCRVACRIAWRPSCWETGGVLVLGLSGAVAMLVSDLPRPWAGALALVAVIAGSVKAWWAHRGVPRVLMLGPDARLDSVPLVACRVQWRGTLAFLQARDATGRVHRLAWWPDTLTPADRRAMRLAVDAMQA